MTTATKPRTFVVREIPLSSINDNKSNPRGPIDPKDVADLAMCIDELGLLEPIILRGDGEDFETIAGHRRRAAFKYLKRDTIPAFVLAADDATDERSLAMMMADNLSHVLPDPVREASVVSRLRGGEGDNEPRSIEGIAKLLGKSKTWVAERVAIAELAPDVVKKTLGKKQNPWSIDATIELARLDGQGIENVLKKVGAGSAPSAEYVAREVLAHIRALRCATWNLDDAELYPKAGACSTCPKTSLRRKELFDNSTDASGLCLDSACWGTKVEIDRALKVKAERAALKEKSDNRKVVLAHSVERWNTPEIERLASGRQEEVEGAVQQYSIQFKASKGSTPVRAFMLDGKNAGKFVNAFLPSRETHGMSSSKPAKKKIGDMKPAEQEKARAANLQVRVDNGVLRRFEEVIEKFGDKGVSKLEDAAVLLLYAGAVGEWHGDYIDKLIAMKKKGAAAITLAACENAVDGLLESLQYRTGSALPAVVKRAKFVAAIVGFDWSKNEAEVRVELAPKSKKAKAVKS